MKTVVFGPVVLRSPRSCMRTSWESGFHVVLRRRCWLSLNGGSPVRLLRGDTVVFPRADAHDMNNTPGIPTRPITELLIKHPMTSDKRFCYGHGGFDDASLRRFPTANNLG